MPEPPRLDHGAIGNGRVLALVSPMSAIEWLCLPRFDSPSLFGRLLDARMGGALVPTSRGEERAGRLEYVPNTNVLRTTFEDDDAAWEVIDFAPRIPEGLSVRSPAEIVRIVRPLRGLPVVGVRFDPQPDYARARPSLTEVDGVIEVRGGGQDVRLFTTAPAACVLSGTTFALPEPVHFVRHRSSWRRQKARRARRLPHGD